MLNSCKLYPLGKTQNEQELSCNHLKLKYLLSETHKVMFILFLKVQSCFIIIIFDFEVKYLLS